MPGSVNMVDADGNVVVVDQAQIAGAMAQGLRLESIEQNVSRIGEEVRQDQYGGAAGKIAAFGAGALRGATLGGSDALLSAIGGDEVRADLRSLREVNPITTTVAEVGGTIAPAFLAPESLLARSPAGYLSRAAAEGVAAGRATGGLAGAAQSLVASGLEGVIQNAGVYLSDTALGDRDLTAEGMAGALGTGFGFGAAGGAVAHGIEAGTIAARRMFARVAEGGDKAAQLAEAEWTRKSQEILEANEQTADIARARLAEARAAREQAGLLRDQAAANVVDARVAAPETDAARARAVSLDDAISKIEAQEQAGAAAKPFGDDTDALRRPIDRGQTSAAISETEAELAPLVEEYTVAKREFDAAHTQVELAPADRKQAVQNWIKGVRSKDSGYYQRSPIGEGSVELPRGRESIFRGTEAERDVADRAMLDKYAGSRTIKQHIVDGDVKIKTLPSTTAQDIEDINALQARERAAVREQRSLGEIASGGSAQTIADVAPGLPARKRYAVVRERAIADVAEAPSTLESQLAEMHERISGGATLNELSAERMLSPRQLEMAHDDAIERAHTATDIGVKQQNLREAAAIEEQLQAKVPGSGAVEDVAMLAERTTRLEKAATNMTEAVGDAAPQAARDAASAFRDAESTVERKIMSRTTRAVDTAADAPAAIGIDGKPLQVGLDRRPGATSEAKIAAAKADKLVADAALARARVTETEAGIGARAAKQAAKDSKAAVRVAPGSVPESSKLDLGTIGAVLETAGSFGIPGIPRPSDIPVVGPLLGAYLKYRALKATVGRFAGRVPATAETKAAALAAQTKDKIARAVDRSLGLIEQAAPKIRIGAIAVSVQVGDALKRRAIDDGYPDASSGASLQAIAAVRIREVANAVTNPQLIIAMVQKETRDIVDSDLISAIEQHQIALYKHLNDTAPKAPPPNPYSQREWEPSMAATMQWGRRLAVANDPAAAFEALHQQSLTPEAADTLRVAWPKLFALAQQRLVSRAGDLDNPVPYRQRLQNSLLFDVPLDTSLDPDNATLLRSVHAPSSSSSSAQPAPTPPPTPSIAGSTNLSALYQPGFDRRSQMR